MYTTSGSVYLGQIPQELAARAHSVSRNNVYDSGGRLIGQLERISESPIKQAGLLEKALPHLQAAGSLASVLNLGVSIASFAYMRKQFQMVNERLANIERKIDVVDEKLDRVTQQNEMILSGVIGLHHGLSHLSDTVSGFAALVDKRHREEVFSNLIGLMEILSYADGKPHDQAKQIVFSNLLPAKQAIHRFNSLVDEFQAKLDPSSPGISSVLKLRTLSTLLSARIDFAIGEPSSAFKLLEEHVNYLEMNAKGVLKAWNEKKPVLDWFDRNNEPVYRSRVKQSLVLMEQIDRVPPEDRLLDLLITDTKPVLEVNLAFNIDKKIAGKILHDYLLGRMCTHFNGGYHCNPLTSFDWLPDEEARDKSKTYYYYIPTGARSFNNELRVISYYDYREKSGNPWYPGASWHEDRVEDVFAKEFKEFIEDFLVETQEAFGGILTLPSAYTHPKHDGCGRLTKDIFDACLAVSQARESAFGCYWMGRDIDDAYLEGLFDEVSAILIKHGLELKHTKQKDSSIPDAPYGDALIELVDTVQVSRGALVEMAIITDSGQEHSLEMIGNPFENPIYLIESSLAS